MVDYTTAENLTNSTFIREIIPLQSTFFLVNDIIFTILCIFGMCVDTAIIYTLLHFKTLHTVFNSFIVNWAIADLCALVIIPSKYRIFEIIEGASIPLLLSSFLFQLEYILQNVMLLFVSATAMDWCFVSYFPGALKTFRKYYKFLIVFIWVLALLSLCISLGLSINELYFNVPIVFLFFGYIALFIFVVILQTSLAIQKCRKKTLNYSTLTLTLPTVFVICWIPIWLSIALKDLIINYFFLLLEFSVLSTPLATFFILYYSSQHFSTCFQQAINFSNNRYMDEVSESLSYNLDNEAEDVEVYFQENNRSGL